MIDPYTGMKVVSPLDLPRNNRAEIENEIRPLLDEISRICKREGIEFNSYVAFGFGEYYGAYEGKFNFFNSCCTPECIHLNHQTRTPPET